MARKIEIVFRIDGTSIHPRDIGGSLDQTQDHRYWISPTRRSGGEDQSRNRLAFGWVSGPGRIRRLALLGQQCPSQTSGNTMTTRLSKHDGADYDNKKIDDIISCLVTITVKGPRVTCRLSSNQARLCLALSHGYTVSNSLWASGDTLPVRPFEKRSISNLYPTKK